jgi:hypothetical protein
MEAFAVADDRDAKIAAAIAFAPFLPDEFIPVVVRRLIASGDFLGTVHLAQRTSALELRRDALASVDRTALIAASLDERLVSVIPRLLAVMPDETSALCATLLERTGAVSENISVGVSAVDGRADAAEFCVARLAGRPTAVEAGLYRVLLAVVRPLPMRVLLPPPRAPWLTATWRREPPPVAPPLPI